MSNKGVAQYLLEHGLPTMKGVVYLDEMDRQMVLLRQGMKVVKLVESGLAWGERFTFYDQVHTTGMDIKQAVDACAAITLGKDMVFRDYAQGAFRMRGIGKGQTLKLIMVPEIIERIRTQVILFLVMVILCIVNSFVLLEFRLLLVVVNRLNSARRPTAHQAQTLSASCEM